MKYSVISAWKMYDTLILSTSHSITSNLLLFSGVMLILGPIFRICDINVMDVLSKLLLILLLSITWLLLFSIIEFLLRNRLPSFQTQFFLVLPISVGYLSPNSKSSSQLFLKLRLCYSISSKYSSQGLGYLTFNQSQQIYYHYFGSFF